MAAGLDRRSLLGLLRPRSRETTEAASEKSGFVPQIKAQLCEGCDICVRICPRGAMRLQQHEASASYVLTQGLCDDCGLCVDICDAGAVSIGRAATGETSIVALNATFCRKCGAPFHWPTARGAAGGLCRVCSAKAAAHSP